MGPKTKSRQKMTISNKLYNILFREILVPLILMITTPTLTLLLLYLIVVEKCDSSKTLVYNLKSSIINSWSYVNWYDTDSWIIILAVLTWGLISLHLPGKPYNGPTTSNGFVPKYWHTGFRFYIISMMVTVPIMWKYSVLHLYYKLPNLIAILCVFGFAFCAFLYIKGLLWPSKGLHNKTNNVIFDYYWGIELYPHITPTISLKVWIICRFGLILWQYVVLMCWKANYETLPSGTINYSLTANAILQTIYLAKFYYWEDGYMNTIDTSVDRFGYYVCWGCIAWVPGFYPIASVYLVKNTPYSQFGFNWFCVVLTAGLLVIALNYWSDQQKLEFRATDGKCIIWRKPAKLIRAEYTDDSGKTKRSILLTSGFWGITRHMNYTFELLSTFLWTVPALCHSLVPYLYLIFLTVLLIHRSVRDDNKCAQKYGKYWQQYKNQVKYQMIPYIY